MLKLFILNLALFSLIAMALPVNAMWICRATNAKGEAFDNLNKDPRIAFQNAMLTCTNNSSIAWNRSCSIRFCQKDYYPVPPPQTNPVQFAPIQFS